MRFGSCDHCPDREKVNVFEVGAKGRFAIGTYALAGFYYDYSNQQVQDTRPGPVSFLVNAPEAEVYGAEAELKYDLADFFKASFSAGYLNTRYKELTLQETVLDGNRLPFAPEFTAQAGLDFIPLNSREPPTHT